MAERRGRPAPSEADAPGRESGDPAAPPRRPRLAPQTRADKAARQERLAAELRRNLQKRKRQQRARSLRQDG